MYASQLIYTACGKDKNGAFGVWSKSADISKVESEEITVMMQYKRPTALPHETTAGELSSLYPKKFGYFRLSSGRFCMAQSAYIGRVYSDLDMRSGNYIIHAFVFDDVDGLLPMSYIGSTVFKTSLSYDEWHENAAPDNLEHIDLSEHMLGLSKSEIDSFFNDKRTQYLELLLQATINSCVSNDKVTFHDVDANLKYWYKALSLCLPKKMQNNLTFCNIYTPIPSVPSQSGTPFGEPEEVKIRNVLPTVMSSIYSYSQDVQNGKQAFDFENNIISEGIVISRYVKSVVKMMRDNLFNALMMVDAIDKLMQIANCSLENAASLYNLQKGNFDWFKDILELAASIKIAKEVIPESIPTIANGLYGYCVKHERWQCCEELLEIYRFVFDFSEGVDKALIVRKYIENHVAFGVADNLPCEEYARLMREKAPFPWISFVDFLFDNEHFKQYFSINGDSFNSRYLAYIALIYELDLLTYEQKEYALNYFVKMMATAIKDESIEQFDILLDGIGSMGDKWETWIVRASLSMLTKDGMKVAELCSITFLLNLVCKLSNQNLAILILKKLTSDNANDKALIAEYVKYAAASDSPLRRYEPLLKNDADCNTFMDNVEMYRFENAQKISKDDLQSYFTRFYSVGKDKGIFKKKLAEYLQSIPEPKVIDECRDMNLSWFSALSNDHADIFECLMLICKTIFALDFNYLIKHAERKGMSAFTPIIDRLHENEKPIPIKYSALKLGMETKAVCGKADPKKCSLDRNDYLRKLGNKTLYGSLQGQKAIDLYVKYFLPDVIVLYLGLSAKYDFTTVIEDCFSELANSSQFTPALLLALYNLDKPDYTRFIIYMFSYSCGRATPLSEQLRHVLIMYLDEMSRGKRKKLFAVVIDMVLPKYRANVKLFIDKYQKEHETFFDRLFGGFDKGNPRDNGEDPKHVKPTKPVKK